MFRKSFEIVWNFVNNYLNKIIDQFNASDTGLVVIDGKLIEKPVLREMQRRILVAEKISKWVSF